MLDETLTATRKIVSLADARARRRAGVAQPLRMRTCCHCGAALGEEESEEECSGAGFGATAMAAIRRAE